MTYHVQCAEQNGGAGRPRETREEAAQLPTGVWTLLEGSAKLIPAGSMRMGSLGVEAVCCLGSLESQGRCEAEGLIASSVVRPHSQLPFVCLLRLGPHGRAALLLKQSSTSLLCSDPPYVTDGET